MEATVTIGGVNCSSYIVFVNRHHGICQMVSEPEIGLDPTWNQAFSPYDEVIITENGTKVFTGFVANIGHSRMPPTRAINCQCPLKKVRDYWLTSFETGGSTVPTLIDSLMTTVGVSYSINDSYDYPTAEEEWMNTSVMDVFKSLLTMAGWQAYSDPDGVVQIGQLKKGSPSHTFNEGDNLINVESARDDSWIRNAIAIYGAPGISVKKSRVVKYAGFERAGAFANPHIGTVALAEELAIKALEEFDSPLFVVKAQVLGDPDVQIGHTASVTDTFTNLYEHADIITTVRSSMSTDGYVLDVTLGERCPTIWGFSVEPGLLYAATAGSGVYASGNYGDLWEAVNGITAGSILTGDALHVNAVEANYLDPYDVWAGTDDGLYRSRNGGRLSWEWQDLGGTLVDWSGGSFNTDEVAVRVKAIDQDELDTERVYFLVQVFTSGSVSDYYQDWTVSYSGGSWTSWEVQY